MIELNEFNTNYLAIFKYYVIAKLNYQSFCEFRKTGYLRIIIMSRNKKQGLHTREGK